jgi:hypothetical protein
VSRRLAILGERDLRDPRGRPLGYRSPAADGRSYEVWVVEGAE